MGLIRARKVACRYLQYRLSVTVLDLMKRALDVGSNPTRAINNCNMAIDSEQNDAQLCVYGVEGICQKKRKDPNRNGRPA